MSLRKEPRSSTSSACEELSLDHPPPESVRIWAGRERGKLPGGCSVLTSSVVESARGAAFLPSSQGGGPNSLAAPQYSQYSHSHDLTAMTRTGR